MKPRTTPPTFSISRQPSQFLAAAWALILGLALLVPTLAKGETPPATAENGAESATDATPETTPAAQRPALPTAPQKGVIIPIHGTIDGGLAAHVQRRTEQALDEGATVIVYECDTPGGSVGAMIDIRKVIDAARQKALTVAWVEHEAISAGALIAMACDTIAMRDGTRLGDCQPILMGAEGFTVGGEKIQTYLRSVVAGDAERCGYPKALAMAMITQEIEVIEIRPIDPADENLLHPQFDSRFVVRRAFENWEHRDKFKIVRVVVQGATTATETGTAPGTPSGTMGTTIGAGELLTMTAKQAREFGFAMPDITTRENLFAALRIGETHGQGPVQTLGITWSVELVRFIQSIGGLLITIGLIALYVEFKTPGFGLGGTVAIIAFGLYFFSNAFIGLAESWEILLFIIGLILIAVEIFIVPGFGVPGILGIVFTLAGLLLAGQEFIVPQTGAQVDAFTGSALSLLLSVVGAVIGMVLVAKFFPYIPILNRVMIAAPPAADGGSDIATTAADGKLLGAVGEAVTDLRPVGKAKFGGDVVDVQTKGKFIDNGARIVVIEAAHGRVIVKPMPTADGPHI